jgi:hypothetical protein
LTHSTHTKHLPSGMQQEDVGEPKTALSRAAEMVARDRREAVRRSAVGRINYDHDTRYANAVYQRPPPGPLWTSGEGK